MAAVFDAQQFRRVGHFFGFGFEAPPIAKPQQKVVRIGLLGASQVSTYAVIAPARFLPGVEVVAVAARDSIRCQEFATHHKIPKAYGSYTELLDDPDIDAVYVGLPNGLHGQWAAAALSVGKSVLCEKPFTANVEEAGRVRDLARRKGRLCREAFHYREHPLMRSVQAQLAEGRLGELKELSVKVLIPAWVFGGANIRFQHALAGGAMMDAGCYCVDVLRLLSGRGAAPRVDSATATLMEGSDCVDAVMQAEVSWGGGEEEAGGAGVLRGRLHASLQHNGPFPVAEIFAEGTEGSMRLDSFIMPFFGHCISWETKRTLTHKAHTMSASQLLDQQRQNQERYQHQQRNQHRQQQQQQQQQEQQQSWQQQQQQGMTSFASTHHTHGGNAAYSSGQGFTQGMDMSGILNHTAAQLDWHNATPSSGFSPSSTADNLSFMYDSAGSAASGSTTSSGADGVDSGGVDSGSSSGMYGDMLWDDIRSTLEDVNAGWLFSTPALRRAHRQRKQARAAAAGRRVRATQREYGPAQQTTYYHQLSRFVDDVQALSLSHATDGAAAQDGTASAHATLAGSESASHAAGGGSASHAAGGGSASHTAGMDSASPAAGMASASHTAAAGSGLGPRDAGGLAAVPGSAFGAASVASGQAEGEAEVRDRAARRESVLSSMDEELEASIANLSFIEGVYAAAGLPKRTPHSDWRY